MPRKAGTPCKQATCAGVVREGVCSVCGLVRRQREDGRQNAHRRGYGARWRKLRLMFLRGHPLCAECEAGGRVVPATDVHHVVPRREGGTDEESNLQALCHSCHSRITARGQGAMDASTIPVTIVAGPPGSGKTTYVREQMRAGDLVVDVDALYAAVSFRPWYDKPVALLPFVIEARDAIIARLGRGSKGVGRAWIVTGESNRGALERMRDGLHAERLMVLDVTLNECYKRLANDERREGLAGQRELVDAWFDKWQGQVAELL